MIRKGYAFFVAFLFITVISGCGSSGNDDKLKQEAMENYANIVYANYEDTYNAALAMQAAIDAFVAAPSAETMQAAKTAWLAAREPYGQTEAFRFYGGPIDDQNGPEGLLNAWPLDELYIDYVDGSEAAGIIANETDYPTINAELIESLNEAGAEENVSTGYHAIEFLLWGQDAGADSAGQRPYTDYVVGEGANAERRGQYLATATALVVEHLAYLVEEWAPQNADNYRAQFLAQAPSVAIGQMLTGIGVLAKSELAGERIFTAYDNQDQEDEHSCFSDNTHRDIILNMEGIRNVYMGEYTRTDGSTVSGTGLDDVIAAADPALNDELVALLDQSLAAVNALHVPFDQAIVLPDSRPQVLDTVNVLQDAGDKIAQAGSSIDITINTALPE